MKLITALLGILTIVSCNQDTSRNALTKSASIEMIKTDNAEIFGAWVMCHTSSYYMNVCPVIHFNNNGTGNVTHYDVIDEYFTWVLKNGVITIAHVDKNGRRTLEDKSYSTTFQKQDDGMELIITDSENDFEYYLARR